ncbi:MAG: response regulator transcription factor [Sphingomonas sp.]
MIRSSQRLRNSPQFPGTKLTWWPVVRRTVANGRRTPVKTGFTRVPVGGCDPAFPTVNGLNEQAADRSKIIRTITLTTNQTAAQSPYVYVVDDDRDVRRSLSFMLGASDIRSYPFGSGADFLDSLTDLEPGCVLLDLRMPKIDGFDVMGAMKEREIDWPIIVMTGHGEVQTAVRAMKLGAIDFIEKPFSENALLSSFESAFALLAQRQGRAKRQRDARQRVDLLTARESDVLNGLLAGETNRQIGERLGISLRTVEMHRSNMMERLQVANLAEALALALEAGMKAPATTVPGKRH